MTTTDYSNNTVTTTDPAAKKRSATGDGLGRMLTVVENPGGSPSYTTTYVYDLLNNLRKVTQGSQTRFFYYDALSRLRREKNPEQGTNTSLSTLTDPVTQNAQWSVEYTYDTDNNLTKKTDSRNISINVGYDTLNRPITRTCSDSTTPPVDYIYDGARVTNGIANSNGRLTAVLTSSPFSSSYTFDSFDEMGRVLHTTETVETNPAYTMSYQYNLAGALTSETYPSNKSYATAYDIAGRIAGVTGPNNKVYADSFTYAPHGGVAQMRLGNQLWEHTNFNNRLQPTEIGIGTAQSGTASVDRLKLTYDYGTTDNNGNVKSQTITVPTVASVTGTTLNQCYTYDEFNRLKTAEEHSGTTCQGTTVWTQKFTYDQQGNRRFDTGTTIPVGFPNPTINTANNNRIDTSQGYLYDLAGNVTQDLSHAYTFDAEERQTKVDNGATGTYSYDGKGQRVKSITSAGTTIYVYDVMGRMIAEYTSGNATGSGTSYITADALGSPRVITAQDKSVKARHDYLPFGEEIPAGYGSRTASQGYIADGLRQKFTGKERDNESGLDYFGSRYYSSAMGRFCSTDSLIGKAANPQSLNRYTYVLNNPLALVDPSGHDPSPTDDCDYYDDELEEQMHKPRVVVIVFQGGNLSDSTHKQASRIRPGGPTPGLGEDDIDVEAVHIAQQIANDFPSAEVTLAGPQATSDLTNALVTDPPDHIIIYGYSAGAVAAVGLTNNLTDRGQGVDEVVTVDPTIGPLGGDVAAVRNPGSHGPVTNYYVPQGYDLVWGEGLQLRGQGVTNYGITQTRDAATPIGHNSADDITSPRVIQRIESRLNQIYKSP